MKGKLSFMWRATLALVLVLSLGVVMAVPVAADVSSAAVTNDPQTVSRPAEYTIVFTTTAALFAAIPNTITITFPADTTVPSTSADYNGNVTVNDTVIADGAVNVSGRIVTIDVPADIPAGSVTVVIDAAAVVKNPTSVATDWTLEVKTSAETTGIDSAVYSTIAAVPPEITAVAGTTYQNSNDTIVITFSELVNPAETWLEAFPSGTAILCGTTALVLTTADFSPADTVDTLTLTITLVETEAHLVNGTDNLKVTPVASQIESVVAAGVYVASVEKTGDISGDSVAPTVALTYDDADKLVKATDTLGITATFSEDMAATPTITIVDAGSVTLVAAVNMAGNAKVWTYNFTVPAGSDGTATVTVSGTDLAGIANATATNPNFVIDNTAPTIAVAAIVGTTIEGEDDTIVITFSEAVTATWGTGAFAIDRIVGTTTTSLTLTGATYSPASGSTSTLTITLSESDGNYLVNGETITVTPVTINDLALNAMSTDAVVGTAVVSGDVTAPTITGIVGIQGGSPDIIKVVFSEAVVPAEATPTWSLNEVALVESPDGAPLNITHAIFAIDGTNTVLTITLNTADAAFLVAGEVICVTPATDAIVDLAGNALAAVEVSSGEAAGLLSVWVDVAGTSAWLAEPTHFETIAEGITAVAIGGTVNVAAGTYNEQVIIDKADLTVESIDGADVTFIDGSGIENTYPAEFALVSIQRNGITFKGFTVQNAEKGKGGVIQVEGFDEGGNPVKISECLITDNIVTSTLYQEGIYLRGASADNTISNNRISETFWDGIAIGSDELCSGNRITGNIITSVSGTHYGILVKKLTWNYETFPTNDFSGTVISGNEVSIGSQGIGVACATGSEASHIVIQDNYVHDITTTDAEGIEVFHGSYIDITGNVLENNGRGIQVKGSDCTNIVANYNDITGNTVYGVEAIAVLEDVDAESNWWGSAVESAIEGMVTTYVDYSPWLDAPYPYGEPTTTDSSAVAYSFDLFAGWNLISLPLIPTNSSIDTVLAKITDGPVLQVQAYNTDIEDFDQWASSGPMHENPTLTFMADGVGFWLEMNSAGALVATGYELCEPAPAVPPAYDVVAGWNLIGYKFTVPGKIDIYLGNVIHQDLQAIYGYKASTGNYFIPDPDDGLEPGYGYWISLTKPGTIYPTLDKDLP